MPHARNLRIIEQIRSSLQERRYDDFVDLFAANAVYELPFALSRSVSRYEGIAAIRARFIDKIKCYRDYPNSAGIAEAVGLLDGYAASITR